jgi:glucose-6-phosphate dehydrogenase assembly protein OpcA
LLRGSVSAEEGNPSADLVAAWLSLRFGISMTREVSRGPGITSVAFETAAGEIALNRPDGRTASLVWPGRPDRLVALHRRETAELLAEELRRLDPDEVYAETLHQLSAQSVPAGGRA